MIKILEIVRLSHSVRSRAPVSRPLHVDRALRRRGRSWRGGGTRAAVGRGPRPNKPLLPRDGRH